MKCFTEKEYTISCAHCQNVEAIYDSDSEYRWNDTPSRYFHRQGWRTDEDDKNICPTCRQKYEGKCR